MIDAVAATVPAGIALAMSPSEAGALRAQQILMAPKTQT
jgi:hypothetical protein